MGFPSEGSMSPTVTVFPKTSRLLAAGILAAAIGAARPQGLDAQDLQSAAPPPPSNQNEQQPEGEMRPPAYLASLEGVARLEREGRSQAAERGVPLVPGDRLQTDAGRLELVFPNGSQVYVDRYGEVELLDPLSLRLARGRLYVRLDATVPSAERLFIDAPGASVEFQQDGEYRVGIGGTDVVEVELVVIRGQAGFASEGGNVIVSQGRRAVVRDGAAPSTPEWFNAGETPLEKWAAEREALWRSGQYASRQYLPEELDDYAATFDRYGSWQNDETYGSVWYPTSTSEDWRPYSDGRWDYTSYYGWTWVGGGDAWAYPTHHYGRWNVGPRGWFWIPSRRWGAAWVYWAVAPGYVGWCPLGWNGHPVVNVFHYDRAYNSRWHDPYRAWSVVGRDSFGRSRPTYVDRGQLGRERPAFVLQHRAPGLAPPRSPYPAPYGTTRIGGRTYGTERAPSGGGVSTMSPRSYGRYGSTDEDRGGHAVPRGTVSEESEPSDSPYERARPYMGRPTRNDDDGSVYRRVPSGESPTRSPGGVHRDRDGDDDRDGARGRSGPGYAGPGYRAPGSPGMSRPNSRDDSPGRSDDNPGSRRAAPRDPPSRGSDDDGGRGSRGGGGREAAPRDNGGAKPPSGSATGGGGSGVSAGGRGDTGGQRSGGGAVRRHP
jgi:hypothetical protein